MKFTRMLPALLKRTNVVLELRDSRLPLTSINRSLEGVLLNSCVSIGQGHYFYGHVRGSAYVCVLNTNTMFVVSVLFF